MVRANLDLDMVYGERVRAWHVYRRQWDVVKWGEGGLRIGQRARANAQAQRTRTPKEIAS